ncbi:hypothetical protein [Emticicia sp. C21]|uniref:hypothetical protein n=1 Tax=Emticicia sp. C21 TaxID=2302915 RepID=UPI000E343F3F|nr:hypothetical protein [Emticicia sp. C21]RFS14976.1 hypothetical protein D0T08_17995 [Emticicia sp. C21]
MKDQDTSFYSQSDNEAIEPNTSKPEKTWDGPALEQERTAEKEQETINQRLADNDDRGGGSDNPPLRSELNPPTAPDIVPDQSPDEINYPGKEGIQHVEQPKYYGSSISSSMDTGGTDSSIGNEDPRGENGEEAQEIQQKEEEERQEKIKEKEADLREAREGRDESIRKSEDQNITDNRGYNEIRENSPVNDDRDKEFLN